MVSARWGSRCRTAMPAMVAAMPAWPVASGMTVFPVPAWQPGGGGGAGGVTLCLGPPNTT